MFGRGHSLFRLRGEYLGEYMGILLRSAKPYRITNQSQSLGIQTQEKPNKARGKVKMSAKNYWFAFGIGVTAGAAIALLYAPQTGIKTRRQLRKGVEDASDYLEDAANYLKEQAERLSKETEKAIKRSRGPVGNAVDKAGDVVKSAMKSAQSLV
jgi:gas vesicle protein